MFSCLRKSDFYSKNKNCFNENKNNICYLINCKLIATPIEIKMNNHINTIVMFSDYLIDDELISNTNIQYVYMYVRNNKFNPRIADFQNILELIIPHKLHYNKNFYNGSNAIIQNMIAQIPDHIKNINVLCNNNYSSMLPFVFPKYIKNIKFNINYSNNIVKNCINILSKLSSTSKHLNICVKYSDKIFDPKLELNIKLYNYLYDHNIDPKMYSVDRYDKTILSNYQNDITTQIKLLNNDCELNIMNYVKHIVPIHTFSNSCCRGMYDDRYFLNEVHTLINI
jgi:hypothetical protein